MKNARISASLRALSLGVAIGACALLTSPSIFYAQAEGLPERARDAVASFRRSNYAEAVAKFEAIAAGRVSAEDAAKVRNEVTEDLAKTFAANTLTDPSLNARLRAVGRWILDGRTTDGDGNTQVNGKFAADTAGIARFVNAYMEETNLPQRAQRAQAIADKYGEFAVPHIVANYLASTKSAGHRGLARTLIATMGQQATPPLLVALANGDADVREYAARALAELRDTRALPALAQAMNSDESEAVKSAAKDAINAMNAGALAATPARLLWFLQAEGYYRNAAVGGSSPNAPLTGTAYLGHLPTLADGASRSYAVWRWRNKSVEFELVPVWNYADCLAETSADVAYRLGLGDCAKNGTDPATDEFCQNAASLAVRIAAHAYAAGRDREASQDENVRKSVVAMLGENGVSRLSHLMGFAGSAGWATVMRALDHSLSDGYNDVSATLCDVAMRLDAPVGADVSFKALVNALSSPDSSVRYAAARALVVAGRSSNYGANTKAAEELGLSLGETDLRTAVLIAEDAQVAAAYRRALSAGSQKYNLLVFTNLADGIAKLRSLSFIDVIVMQGALGTRLVSYVEAGNADSAAPKATQESAVKLIRDDLRTKTTPMLLVAPDAELAGLKGSLGSLLKDNEYASYGVEGGAINVTDESFHASLAALIEGSAAARERTSNAQVAASANAVLSVDPNASSHEIGGILRQLSASVAVEAGRSTDAKLALCAAIAHVASWKAMPANTGADAVAALSRVLLSEGLSTPPKVRAAAARAMGSLFNNHPALYAPGSDAFRGLLATLRLQPVAGSGASNDDIVSARSEAGIALGRARLTPHERLTVKEASNTGNIPVTKAAPAN